MKNNAKCKKEIKKNSRPAQTIKRSSEKSKKILIKIGVGSMNDIQSIGP